MGLRVVPAQRRPSRAARGLWRRAHGQSIVEFALILPLFLVLVFGIVEFGRAYIVYVTVTNAAREGARLGTTGADASDAATRSQTASGSCQGAATGAATVDIASGDAHGTLAPTSEACSTAASGPVQWVRVQQTYSLDYVTPLGGVMGLLGGNSWGSSVTITGSACMRLA
jgi:Flp pilus assembly protein TadG